MSHVPPSASIMRLARLRNRAFSMVEVVLSIGIVSFVLVSILGIIPVGLTTFRRSMDSTIEAQIAQKLFTDIQQTPFDALSQVQLNYYFDEEGAATDRQEFVYHALVDLPATGTKIPSAISSGAVNEDLRQITVEISRNRTVAEAKNQAPRSVTTYCFFTANVGS